MLVKCPCAWLPHPPLPIPQRSHAGRHEGGVHSGRHAARQPPAHARLRHRSVGHGTAGSWRPVSGDEGHGAKAPDAAPAPLPARIQGPFSQGGSQASSRGAQACGCLLACLCRGRLVQAGRLCGEERGQEADLVFLWEVGSHFMQPRDASRRLLAVSPLEAVVGYRELRMNTRAFGSPLGRCDGARTPGRRATPRGHSGLAGCTSQISRAYWSMVRSEEKKPLQAV